MLSSSFLPCFPFWLSLLMALSARSQSPAQTFFPASIPLANRSPYLSAWLVSINGTTGLSRQWPMFTPQEGPQDFLGWAGKIRVDGMTYQWMGQDSGPPSNITNIQITPTRSIFTMQAGLMNVTVTFLSPIEPSDWVLQSLPFSYVSVEASSLDGQPHDVQVYSDISAEWLSGNRGSPVTWSQNQSGGSVFHKIQLQTPQDDVESVNQQVQDGTSYYAMANASVPRPGLSWQIDKDNITRSQFHDHGILANAVSTFTTISTFTVFAIAADIGQIQNTPGPITWAVGLVRNSSIAYTAPDSAVHHLSPYFVTKYGTDIGAAIDDFTAGYNDTLQRAITFDAAIIANASAVSSQYVDLVSLAARQSFSTLEITVSTGSDGKPNASEVRIFMKDIGSGTTTARVNPVERIYAALPALLYFNASLVGPMLAPLLDAQDDLTSMPYAAQDIGLAYPNATGTHGTHRQGVEQTGNMLVMLYAHARFSGDGSLLHVHYNLTKRWADYLVNNTLTPSDQLSVDNEGSANMTNLAIKGIVGMKAMAQISHALGEDEDGQQYDSRAAALFGQWQALALSSDQQHLLGTYEDQTSWALMYNLYADRLLGTNLVSQTVLQGQTTFYKTLLSSIPEFGIALDNKALGTSAAWLLFTAAIVQDNGVRDSLVQNAWNRASSNLTTGAFADQYNVETGAILGGSAGPAVGGVFSLLALNLSPKDIVIPDQSATPNPAASHSSTPVGAIAGGVVGGVALAALIAVGVIFCLRRRRRNHPSGSEKIDVTDEAHRPVLSPYYTRLEGQANTSEIGSDTSLVPPNPENGLLSSQPLKTRNLSRNTRLACVEPISYSSNVGPNVGTASSPTPLSQVAFQSQPSAAQGAGQSPFSPTDMLELRTEVENLRRVMQEIQEERLAPPPEYSG